VVVKVETFGGDGATENGQAQVYVKRAARRSASGAHALTQRTDRVHERLLQLQGIAELAVMLSLANPPSTPNERALADWKSEEYTGS
jgi:hypothetical protein